MSRSTHSHHPGFGEEEERRELDEIERQEAEEDFIRREEEREYEEDRLRKLYESRVRSSGVPTTLHALTLEKLRALDSQPELFLALTAWRDGQIPGLFLYGDVGRGKTYMAAAAALGLMHKRPVKFAPVPMLTRGLMADFRSDEYAKALRILSDGDRLALVLDDLGQERSNDSVREQLHTIIDWRYLAKTPLLITSNFTPSQLGERYGAWLASRLADMRCLRAVGPDIRLEGP